MLKHVGKHNDRKIVILFRQVPGEDHMALVVYSDVLPRMIHDEVMKCLESPVGQQVSEFSDALFRVTMADGRNCLETLHREGMIKKVQTNQVIVTPTTTSKVRLDELNTILNEMAKGEEAVKKLAELDAAKGATGTQKTREVGEPAKATKTTSADVNAKLNQVLTDADLARERLNQAEKMKQEAEMLISEAERLVAEAAALDPTVKVKRNVGRPKKVQAN